MSGSLAVVCGAEHDLSRVDDLLFAGERIRALQTLQEITGCSLREAIEAISPRFDTLVATKPERFVVPLANYWSNFYT